MHRTTVHRSISSVTLPLFFIAILMVLTFGVAQAADPNPLGIESTTVLPTQQTGVSVVLTQTEGTVYSLDLTITYEHDVVSFVSGSTGSATSGWLLGINDTTPGTLIIGMAGGSGLTAGGDVLVLTFQAAASAGDTALTFTRGELNEGDVPVTLIDGSIVVNTPPTSYDDNYDVDEDNPLTVLADGVLTNDGDIDGHALTATKLTNPSHGSVTLNADGSLSYTPVADFFGADSFTYSATDIYGASDTATVNITVNAVNDPPVAEAGGPYSVDEGGSVGLDGSGSIDVDDTTGFIYEWDLDGNDTYETTGIAPTFDASSLDGPSQVTVKMRVQDSGGATSASDTATINVQNVAPTADAGGPYSVVQGDTIQLDGSGSRDPAGAADPLTYAWDLDDNGIYESSGVSPSFDSSGFALGLKSVSLKVTDDDGGESTVATATVNVVARTHDLAGQVTFWLDGSAVSGVDLSLTGSSTRNITNESDGTFELLDIPEGNCTLSPSKNNELDGITAYDAALVLQHASSVATLSGSAEVAANVNLENGISALDASIILQRAVDLDTWPYVDGLPAWVFDPSDYSYAPLDSDMTAQDYKAILMGDVSGSWASVISAAEVPAYQPVSVANILHKSVEPETGTVHIVLRVPDGAPPQVVVSVEATILYASNSAQLVSVDTVAPGWMMATNTHTPGVVKVALASAGSLESGSPIVEFVLRPTKGQSLGEAMLLDLSVNEIVYLKGNVLRLPYLLQ